MNLLENYVTKVIGRKEYVAGENWGAYAGNKFVIYEVEANCYGKIGSHLLWFEEKKEEDVKEGYMFMA